MPRPSLLRLVSCDGPRAPAPRRQPWCDGNRFRFRCLLGASLCLLFVAAPAQRSAFAGDVVVNMAGGSFSVPLTSFKEGRFRNVVRQRYDFSCGSAAIATLLTYHYTRPTTEADAFRLMWERGDRDLIRKQGFSLLDMKVYLESIGLQSDGFEVDLDDIADVGIPGIALIDTNGYKHFVVVKGLRESRVLVGDPARGLQVMQWTEFQRIWNGVFFVIHNDMPTGRDSFNRTREWRVRAPAPFGTALDRQSLASFSVLLPGPNDL